MLRAVRQLAWMMMSVMMMFVVCCVCLLDSLLDVYIAVYSKVEWRSATIASFRPVAKKRKAFMGTAVAVTVLSIFITGYGFFAISGSQEIITKTAWAIAARKYKVLQGEQEFEFVGEVLYFGLRKFVVHTCRKAPGPVYLEWGQCSEQAEWWSQATCSLGEAEYHGMPCGQMDSCQDASIGSQFWALTTFVTLLFALMGCLTRIRKVSISPLPHHHPISDPS